MPRFPACSVLLTSSVTLLLTACVSAPFSYSEDRCLGSYNQCRTSCTSVPDGAAQSACFSRCLDSERQCRATGNEGAGSNLAQDSLIGRAQTEREKEAAFREYKARKVRERVEAAEKAESE